MGNLATPGDGMDSALLDIGALADAFGAELAAEGAEDTVGQAISLFGALNPSGLDGSIAGYVGAMGAGADIVTRTDAMSTPLLLELPMSFGFDGGIGNAPVQQAVNLGTVKLGSQAIVTTIGTWETDPSGNSFGIIDAGVHNKTGGNWLVDRTEIDNNTGYSRGEYFVQFTPDTAGSFLAQVNVLSVVVGESTIITYTVTVVP